MTATAWHKSDSGHWIAFVQGHHLELIPLHPGRRRTGWTIHVDRVYRDTRPLLTQARSRALALVAP